ncbi:MAG: enoyl-CoA hydratase, partial [Actinobacteria bacterium]|nr:enoyl-CoA hydratase [Actinomycetota bacterium]MSZ05055.1 enoyl-CoA hydratase [Actinomycetota bacterium]
MGDAQNPVGVEQQGRVLVATMDDGRANAMTLTMTGALRAVIRDAENDPGIGAVVIAGREGRFSGG